MKKWVILFSLIIFTSLFSCMESAANESKAMVIGQDAKGKVKTGEDLFNKNCKLCHKMDASHGSMLAPPMTEVKKAYFSEDKSEFIKAIASFAHAPDATKSKMPEAVAKYKLMKKVNISDVELRSIAEFIYDEVEHID